MKDNIYKILFSLVILTLTFFGRFGSPFLPDLTMGNTASGLSGSSVPPKYDAIIYAAATAELLSQSKNPKLMLTPTFDDQTTSVGGTLPASSSFSVKAKIWHISDLTEEKKGFEFNADKRWPIASLTKLMTAVIALENITHDSVITLSNSALMAEGSAGGFAAGEQFRRDDMLRALLLVSSNDAALALAERIGTDNFVNMMNTKAKSLNMSNTFFKEPTGLSVLNQSTGHDLKILVKYLYAHHSEIFAYSRQIGADIIDLNSGRRRTLKNINHFAGRPDFLGGKTGYTDDAGENLVSLFSRQGKPILVIVLNAQNRFDETLSALKQLDNSRD